MLVLAPNLMKISRAQLSWFRLCRSGLVDPFPDPVQTARALLGVQAQLLAASDLSFWNRSRSCTREQLDKLRLEQRELVRFWGQRNTIHLYATDDWPWLYRLFEERKSLFEARLRKSGMTRAFARLVSRTRKRLEQGKRLAYKDIRSPTFEAAQEPWAISYVTFMALVRAGVTCHGAEVGAQSQFVHREHWCPDLDWKPPSAGKAFPELVTRYLSAYGPAGVADLAFWYGTSQRNARQWIEAAGKRCSEIDVAGESLLCSTQDLPHLAAKAPPPSRWPVRLLYRFDPLLLSIRDKQWLIDEAHYKRVWRAAAHVEPVLLVAGRIAGTWRYERKSKVVNIAIQSFAPLSIRVRRAAAAQAAGVARFLDLDLGEFEMRT
jgi:hypothetical protein